jgi:hypothetical protein
MDRLQTLQALFTGAEDRRFTIEFTDGDCRDLIIVSASHVMPDDTVIGVPLTLNGIEAAAPEPAIQFHLQDVARVHDFDTRRLLFSPA